MAKKLTLDVTSFKFEDNETDLKFRAIQNGVIISDSTLSATIKIKQADVGYLKSVSAKWVDNYIVISSDDLSDLPVGSYLLELWLGSQSGYEIYPDSGFVRLYINKNATGITGNLISSITLGEFQQQFSDLAKGVNNKIDDLHTQTDSNTSNISMMSNGDYSPKANQTDLESLQSVVNNQSSTISAESLVFRWGTINANDGSFAGVNNTGATSTRAISYSYNFRKGTKFSLQDKTNYKAWLNIFHSNGSWNKSISLNSVNEWVLEEDSILYVVLAITGDGAFSPQVMVNIQKSIQITSLKSDFDFMFPSTSRLIKSDSIDWYYLTIDEKTGYTSASSTRLSSDYIFVTKGTIIYSENPTLGQWAVHTFNLDKTVRSATSKLFGNSYLNILIEEDSYIRITIANPTNTAIDAGGEVAKKIATIKLPFSGNIRSLDSINNPTQKVPLNFFEFIYGSGNIVTGELTSGGLTRIRNNQPFFVKKNSIIEIESDQQFAVYFYDISSKKYNKNYSIGFLKERSKFFVPDDGYLIVVLAASDNSNIEDISDLASKVTLTVKNDNYIILQGMTSSQNTKALEEINLPFTFGSSLAFVGDELWLFYPSEDNNSTQVEARAYKIDFEIGNIIQTKSIKINWGHVNTLNYCEENDSLVFSNGNIGDTNARSKKFYVLEKFTTKSSQSSIDISECIAFDVSTLGIENTKGLSVALQPCWGEDNDYRHNIIYLLWNDGNNKMISKVLLGQGTNNLGSGTFIVGKASNEFNGTMKLIKTFSGHTYTDNECTQDVTYAYGYLFEGIGHDGFWYDKIKLSEIDDTFSKQSFQDRYYSSDGNLYNTVTNGIAIKDGYLFATVYHRANTDSNVDYVKLVSRKLV